MSAFEDKYQVKPTDSDSAGLGTLDEDHFAPKFKGEIIDTVVLKEDGRFEIMEGVFVEGKAGDEFELPTGSNLVVDSCSKLIAALIKGHAGHSGATYWEVGAGNSSWNDNSPPAPVAGDTALFAASYRKAIQAADITFLDGSNNVTASVTNKIQIVVTFGSAEANGYLREFAIFGGNATATLGSGLMINRKTHGVIFKTSGIDLKRTMRFTF